MTMAGGRAFEGMFTFTLILLVALAGLNDARVSPKTPIGRKSISKSNTEYNEDAHLTARELITKYGYRGETHHVETGDGHILELHRVTGPKSNSRPFGKPVAFLMHGLLSSSVDWLISGPEKAFAYILADQGYDVWLGNARGNSYSRKHKKYSVLDKKFWMFSWHEIGVEDLPSMIDYVRGHTKKDKIFYVGHSQGTTSFFVMCSEKPEYNDKIHAMFAMAPVTYMKHMSSPFFKVMSQFDNLLGSAMEALGSYEFQPTDEFLNRVKAITCDAEASTQPLCENIMFLVGGYGTDQMNKTLLPAILGHVPAGSSVRQMIHYAQLMKSDGFTRFNHGWWENLKRYRQFSPPKYDLSKVTAPVILHYSVNDIFSHVKDVNRLEEQLPNIHSKLRVPNPKFAHLDYMWGVDAYRLLYNQTVLLMNSLH
ncbi:lipase 3-like [Diachasmimorpha longicaudata]|uniref:lipase 3-like n=1 Tax=Diachasmimorpha longicaudata TaxID=58733 RepID=UPI0030B90458